MEPLLLMQNIATISLGAIHIRGEIGIRMH